MHNDWSSFTSERLASLPPYSPDYAPGALEWTKIDSSCLARADLDKLLVRGCAKRDPALHRMITAAKRRVQKACRQLKRYGITKVCVGVSWCDYECWPGGRAWIEWYLQEYARYFKDVTPRITFTPPTLTIDGGTINSPPRDPILYAEFVYLFLSRYGHLIGDYVELWNEWGLVTDYKVELDPGYRQFKVMTASASLVVHHFGKKAVLGGIAGITKKSVQELSELTHYGLFRYVDVVGFHDLRGTWSDDVPSAPIGVQVGYVQGCTKGRPDKHRSLAADLDRAIERARPAVREVLLEQRFRLRPESQPPEVWLTEYGFPVVCPEGRFETSYLARIQAALFANAVDAQWTKAISRIYWYKYQDFVGESVRKHTTGMEDVLQFYFGIVDQEGKPRFLGRLLAKGGPEFVHRYALERRLFPLVDAASLGRTIPDWFSSQKKGRKSESVVSTATLS